MTRVGTCFHFVLQSDDGAEKDREGSPCQEEEEVATATKVFRGCEALEVPRRSTKEGHRVRTLRWSNSEVSKYFETGSIFFPAHQKTKW
jgi:hypothetical protein